MHCILELRFPFLGIKGLCRLKKDPFHVLLQECWIKFYVDWYNVITVSVACSICLYTVIMHFSEF